MGRNSRKRRLKVALGFKGRDCAHKAVGWAFHRQRSIGAALPHILRSNLPVASTLCCSLRICCLVSKLTRGVARVDATPRSCGGLSHRARDSYQEFRKTSSRSPPFQSDHLLMPDGLPTPTTFLIAGWLQAVTRDTNRARHRSAGKGKGYRNFY